MAIRSLKVRWTIFICLALVCASVCNAEPLVAIAYHDITLQRSNDAYAISVAQFRDQMNYLRDAGYVPVSLQQIEQARQGTVNLPDKPVLLTFDDGLVSFKSSALPILREFGYPSVLAIVTAWVDRRSKPELYDSAILSWNELREIQKGKDVEIITHSDDMHHGVTCNPQGNKAAAAVTHEYRNNEGYESDSALNTRLQQDLQQSMNRIRTELLSGPSAVAWPFGQYSATGIRTAASLGIPYYLTLDERPTLLMDLPRVNRQMMYRYQRINDFSDMLTFRKFHTEEQRFIELKLDEFAGLDTSTQEKYLSRILSRLELLKPNAVIVHPFSSDQQQAFFPNSAVNMASDFLNRVIMQLRTRLHVDHVYLRIPAISNIRESKMYYRELARLNRFDGVLIEKGVSLAEIESLTAQMREYLPTLQVGVTADTMRHAELVWMDVLIDESRNAITGKLQRFKDKSKLLCLLKFRRKPTTPALLSAMQTLRDNGVLHYGFTYTAELMQTDDLKEIFQEFHAFVIRETEKN